MHGRVLPQADTCPSCVWALGRVEYTHPRHNKNDVSQSTIKLVSFAYKDHTILRKSLPWAEKVKIADAWLGIYPSLTEVTGTLVERVGSLGWSVEFEGNAKCEWMRT